MSTLQVKNVQKLGLKKENFVFNQDLEATVRFGEINPLQFTPVEVGDETHHYSFNTVVRLAPLVNPVFGRIMYKVTHHFVSLKELFPSYESVLSELPKNYLQSHVVNTASVNDPISSYAFSFPQMPLCTIFGFFLKYGRCTWRLVVRNGNNNVSNAWQTDSGSLNNGALGLFFGSNFTPNNGILDASDLAYYKYSDLNINPDGTQDDTLTPDNSDFQSFCSNGAKDYMFLVKCTEKGRRLFKILTGLGYRLSFLDSTSVNILPLIAYYKAWFDYYSIGIYQNWTDTNCAKLLTLINNDVNQLNRVHTMSTAASVDETEFIRLFDLFLDDLTNDTYYSDNVDFVSACLPADGSLPSVNGVIQSLEGSLMVASNSTGSFDYQTVYTTLATSNTSATESIGGPTNISGSVLDAVSIDLLKRLYISQHSNSALGYDIAARLRAKGYSTFVDDVDSRFIGEFSFPIKVSDVDSTVDNYDPQTETGKPLGAYAGKGLAFRTGDSFTFQARELGYIISLCTIYPITKVANAVPHYLKSLDRFTWYNPEYDGLSFEEVARNQVGHFTGTEYVSSSVRENQRFGFLPRYTSKKTSVSNILNGGFALKSERNYWLPYSLDRVIVENEFSAIDVQYTAPSGSAPGQNTFRTFDESATPTYFPTAGETWRYIDNLIWKGNYDRIFTLSRWQNADSNYVDTQKLCNPDPDNFIVQCECDHNAYIGMLPAEDSWQTQDDEKPHLNQAQKQ